MKKKFKERYFQTVWSRITWYFYLTKWKKAHLDILELLYWRIFMISNFEHGEDEMEKIIEIKNMIRDIESDLF
jgi:hypothetical protein